MGKRKKTLPPGLRVRNGKYHYLFQLAGVSYSGSTGCAATPRNLTAALRKLSQARTAAEGGELPHKLSPKPFSDAAREFLDWSEGEHRAHPATALRHRTSMTSLAHFFHRTPVHAITAGQIEDYKAWRRSCGIRDITLRHDLHALSLLFQYAGKHAWAHRNVVREVSMPSGDAERIHVLTPAEEDLYFTLCASNQNLTDHARMILETGMRPEETLKLRFTDCDLLAATLKTHGKTKAARRTLRLRPAVLALLVRRRATQSSPWVFPSRRTGRHIRRLNGVHDRALLRYNQPSDGPAPAQPLHFVLYDLRHTFATRMAEQGCPLPTLAAILGHNSLRTIGKYVHPSQESQDEAILRYGQRSNFGQVQGSILVGPGGSAGVGSGGRVPAPKPLSTKVSV